jgi:hypothetical protein
MENQSTSQIYDTAEGPSMWQWIKTLSEEDQQEWNRVHALHEAMVSRAVIAGNVQLVGEPDNVTQMIWASMEIHENYLAQIDNNDNDIYTNFWTRYRSTLE